MQTRRIGEALRGGLPVPDRAFDEVLPVDLKRSSERHWSPVAVAMLAARWLARDGCRVVDVGSGGGKFCIIGALVTGAEFVGIEQRPHLVAAARELARRFNVADRVEFVHGDVAAFDATKHDAFYIYNPFEENVLERGAWIDESIELSEAKFDADVRNFESLLERLDFGANVVTYEGFGGAFPNDFKLLRSAPLQGGQLCFWRKRHLRQRSSASL